MAKANGDRSAATVREAVLANSEVQEGLRNSEEAAEYAVDVIGRVSGSIHTSTDPALN